MIYSQKLKDPRWQKKRLEILQRDNFTCRYCGNTKETLNVHHYVYNGEPWEVSDGDAVTLCESCHKIQHLKNNFTKTEYELYSNVEIFSMLVTADMCTVKNPLYKLKEILLEKYGKTND
jgi:transcription elongation factor Elf1